MASSLSWFTYVAVFAALAQVMPGTADTAIAAALSALMIRPLVGLLWRSATWLFYGRRASPHTAVASLAERLRDHRTPDEIAGLVCDTVVRWLGLPAAVLETRIGDRLKILAVSGSPSTWPPIVAFALHHNGEQVGRLTVAARPGETGLDSRDTTALRALADQVASVVATLRLREDVLASRERIVTSREEERRRLRRDLHDGLGPMLAGIRLRLEAAGITVNDSSPTATDRLGSTTQAHLPATWPCAPHGLPGGSPFSRGPGG